MFGRNIIQPTGTLPRNFFQGNIQTNPILNRGLNSNVVNKKQSDCIESQYLNKLGSNIVFVANADRIPKYSCAELGSPMRPATDLSQALSIVQTCYTNTTPVTISFSPGNYTNTTSRTLDIPSNVVGLVCTQGSAKIKCDLISKNLEKLDIQNIDLFGNLNIISDENHKGKVVWKNGNLYGKYKYTVTDSAVQSFTMENVDQFVNDELDGLYDNEILVTEKGVATIHKVNCVLESKFKGKVDVSDTGILNRYTERCTVTSGGETTNLSGHAVMDDRENQNKTHHIETDNGSQKDYWILNLVESGKIRWEKNKSTHQGEFSDGSFWYNVHGQNETIIEKIHDSCVYKISGLGGFLSLDGKDQCKIKVRKQNDVVEASKNRELRPLYVRNLSDNSTLDQRMSNSEFSAPSHIYKNTHNNKSQFKLMDNTIKYTLAGCHRTCNDDSIVELDYNNYSIFCDEEIGYFQKKVLNNNSIVSEKLTNSTEKLCNDGTHSIYDVEQNGTSEFRWSGFNTTCQYKLENRSVDGDKNKKPCVYSDDINESSKLSISSKESNYKIVAGKNCNGISNGNFKDKSESYKSTFNSSVEMILEDENAVGINMQMMHNTLNVMNEDNKSIVQTGGKTLVRHIQNDYSHCTRDSSHLTFQHSSNENSKTIEEVLSGNAIYSSTDNFSIEKSDGTLYSLTTNGNSSANSKRKNGSYCGKKQLAIRQTNDESTQSVRADGVELNGTLFSNSTNDQTNIIYNGTDHIGAIDGESINLNFVNSTVEGNIDTRKSTIGMKECTMKGKLHAVDCDSVESVNCLHQSTDNTCPIILDNSKTCNIQSSKIQTTASSPHIQTKTDGNCKVNLKGVIFVDTEENSSLACIETDGTGETVCEVGTCSSKRSKFLSAKSEQDGKSTTTFSRNNEFGSDGLNPTVDGQVVETSTSLVVQNGSLVSTPEDDCGSNDDGNEIQIIPRNISDVPYFTMYYCLALPQYDYFVSSSISFKDIIDSYHSKDAKSGCFTATSVRCMTDENGDPIDGMYIMIDGVRTPNDKNALQTDKDGNIIDRNLKDSLYMEKYHITKIDPITKRSVAQLGGNLQYTDGSGTGATTCIPRLIFPIHYASGEWAPLQNGYIEWNYDNKKETDYKRELRFFTST